MRMATQLLVTQYPVLSMFPGIRYAGRLVSDPPSNLGQGEATMFSGTGSQTGTNGRWGDYSMTTIDPADGISFWTVGEYYIQPALSTGTRAWANSNSRRSGLRRRQGPAQLRRLARNRATGLRSLVHELAKQFASSLNEAIQVECVGRNAASSPDMLPFQRLINNH